MAPANIDGAGNENSALRCFWALSLALRENGQSMFQDSFTIICRPFKFFCFLFPNVRWQCEVNFSFTFLKLLCHLKPYTSEPLQGNLYIHFCGATKAQSFKHSCKIHRFPDQKLSSSIIPSCWLVFLCQYHLHTNHPPETGRRALVTADYYWKVWRTPHEACHNKPSFRNRVQGTARYEH